ncbi:MAG: ABC transporter permease [Verrucomicrobiota bacterium]|nr:ABC transporter permease [Verrucomicrobiota bacterium]MDG1890484.1 ABC transporter permease [Verrucomicrobiota bacterium]
MKKIFGISGIFLVVFILTALMSESFLTPYNLERLILRTSLFGIISIGVAFVIITSGIDLSIGSVICLIGCGLPWLLTKMSFSLPVTILTVLGCSLLIGWMHGLLITKLKLQPFVVTLCGLLMYRGITRGFTGDQTQGFGQVFKDLRWYGEGRVAIPGISMETFGIPVPFFILLLVAVMASIFLNRTIYGRYLMALGRNEQAARYSGINTDRMIILAYVICATMAGLGGVLFILDVNSAQPVDMGNFYELYAIAAAVLGGCSLRGGQGTILGVVIGAGLMQVLRNMITLVDWIPTHIEYAVIGAVILVGVIADEVVKRFAAARRAAASKA